MKLCIIMGTMKAGTTSLYAYLRTHPEIFASKVKEPSFFTELSPTAIQIAAYQELFTGISPAAWACEASTNYTKYPTFSGVPRRIHAMYPDARLIYILRHPVERIYSHYIHNLVQGRERRGFKTAVLGEDIHYLNVSRYYMQLSQYLEFFPPEKILVLIFEDFVRQRLETLRRIFAFLGINQNFTPPNLQEKHNVSLQKTMTHPLLRTVQSKSLYTYIPSKLQHLLWRLLQQPTPHKAALINPVIQQKLMANLIDDIDHLQSYLGTPITAWGF